MIGKTIESVRWMNDKELEEMSWEGFRRGSRPVVIELSGGSLLFASRDDELNGPGTMIGRDDAGNEFYVQPVIVA